LNEVQLRLSLMCMPPFRISMMPTNDETFVYLHHSYFHHMSFYSAEKSMVTTDSNLYQ